MKRLILLGLAIGCTSGRPQEGETHLLARCPESVPTCVQMTVGLADTTLLASVSDTDSAGYAEFRILATGLMSEPGHLIVRGYVDGLWCSEFGQATVAAIAEDSDGVVELLSTSGTVAVPPTVLRIGCPDCLHDLESGRTYRTPGWDMTLAGYGYDAVGMLVTGEPVVLTTDACLTLTGTFRRIPRSDCDPNLAAPERTSREAGACT